ncbi:MAG: hypothetical protein ACRDHP_04720, partial [Ktedonobacterales bacterium]
LGQLEGRGRGARLPRRTRWARRFWLRRALAVLCLFWRGARGADLSWLHTGVGSRPGRRAMRDATLPVVLLMGATPRSKLGEIGRHRHIDARSNESWDEYRSTGTDDLRRMRRCRPGGGLGGGALGT